ncbi:hypothetical protein [Peristeroidobacter soli]|uniref:hypothetical protein n=1 Tax=Peristeroidobacter soli TaxID=2497877 RepID=UPI00101DC5CB|nr:hypothetical protein [Peristeroidobacter soli]
MAHKEILEVCLDPEVSAVDCGALMSLLVPVSVSMPAPVMQSEPLLERIGPVSGLGSIANG